MPPIESAVTGERIPLTAAERDALVRLLRPATPVDASVVDRIERWIQNARGFPPAPRPLNRERRDKAMTDLKRLRAAIEPVSKQHDALGDDARLILESVSRNRTLKTVSAYDSMATDRDGEPIFIPWTEIVDATPARLIGALMVRLDDAMAALEAEPSPTKAQSLTPQNEAAWLLAAKVGEVFREHSSRRLTSGSAAKPSAWERFLAECFRLAGFGNARHYGNRVRRELGA